MRELKVRAWYKPYKQMCNVSMLQFDYDGTICAAVIIEKPFYDRKLVEAERKNFTDKSLYDRIIKTIESRALNNAVILHQITAEHALLNKKEFVE